MIAIPFGSGKFKAEDHPMALTSPPKWFFLHIRQLFLYLLFTIIALSLYYIIYLNFLKDIQYFTAHYFGIRLYLIVIASIVFQSPSEAKQRGEKIENEAKALFHSKPAKLLILAALYLTLSYFFFVYLFSDYIVPLPHDLDSINDITRAYLCKFVLFLIFVYYLVFGAYPAFLPLNVFFHKYLWRGHLEPNSPWEPQI